jgi:hypothetical protein
MQPFSITLFATTGDPEGIRHLDKSNWSGCGKTEAHQRMSASGFFVIRLVTTRHFSS